MTYFMFASGNSDLPSNCAHLHATLHELPVGPAEVCGGPGHFLWGPL